MSELAKRQPLVLTRYQPVTRQWPTWATCCATSGDALRFPLAVTHAHTGGHGDGGATVRPSVKNQRAPLTLPTLNHPRQVTPLSDVLSPPPLAPLADVDTFLYLVSTYPDADPDALAEALDGLRMYESERDHEFTPCRRDYGGDAARRVARTARPVVLAASCAMAVGGIAYAATPPPPAVQAVYDLGNGKVVKVYGVHTVTTSPQVYTPARVLDIQASLVPETSDQPSQAPGTQAPERESPPRGQRVISPLQTVKAKPGQKPPAPRKTTTPVQIVKTVRQSSAKPVPTPAPTALPTIPTLTDAVSPATVPTGRVIEPLSSTVERTIQVLSVPPGLLR